VDPSGKDAARPDPAGTGTGAERPGIERSDIGVAAAVAFLTELVLVGLAAVAGWRLGTPPWTSILLAIGLPAVVVAVWSRWFAPMSRHRVRARGPRLAGQAAVILAVAALAAASGLLWWGVAVAAVGITAFAVAG
jgi:hypothetical protein